MQIASGDAERDNSLVGFFNNPKRFNVAVTRAQALLVVLGHPAMLKQDRYWRALVRRSGLLLGARVSRTATVSARVDPATC